MTFVLSILLLVMLGLVWRFGTQAVASRRRNYIRSFEFPMGLFDKLRKQHPQLDLKQCQLVAQALRQFFLAHLKSGRRFVAMPSQAADDLWHEFILYTRNYDAFCRKAFGRFMHHTPAVVMGSNAQANAGLRRCWFFTCKEENINPRAPTRMPLLFALDAKLGVANGFRYVPDCGSVKRQGAGNGNEGGGAVHCCSHFSDASFAGGGEGFGDGGSFGGFTDASSDGGSSCGGGGCGGGGGGD